MTLKKPTWRDLPAGLDLDIVVGTVLGWTEIERRAGWYESPDGPYEDEYLTGIQPGQRVGGDTLPRFSADACYEPPLPEHVRWFINGREGRYQAIIAPYLDDAPLRDPLGVGETLQLARIRAWLEMKEIENEVKTHE